MHSNHSTTRQLGNSATRQLGNSATRQLENSIIRQPVSAVAPKERRIVATGGATRGAARRAEPVETETLRQPAPAGAEAGVGRQSRASTCSTTPPPPPQGGEVTNDKSSTGFASLHPWLQPVAPLEQCRIEPKKVSGPKKLSGAEKGGRKRCQDDFSVL